MTVLKQIHLQEQISLVCTWTTKLVILLISVKKSLVVTRTGPNVRKCGFYSKDNCLVSGQKSLPTGESQHR